MATPKLRGWLDRLEARRRAEFVPAPPPKPKAAELTCLTCGKTPGESVVFIELEIPGDSVLAKEHGTQGKPLAAGFCSKCFRGK